jgi:sugar lactone lactonase YvrE
MATDLSPSAGTLYRISPELEVTAMRTGVSISNGLDWSPDGRTFYFTDSTTRCVDVYDFDVATGDISNRRLLIQLPDPIATPDGMAVDADGTLWIAMWDGGCVRRFDPQGGLLETIELPVSRPTSVAFGGENLDRLFVTSARNGLSASQLAEESHPGAIFVIEPGVTGRLPHAFDG